MQETRGEIALKDILRFGIFFVWFNVFGCYYSKDLLFKGLLNVC